MLLTLSLPTFQTLDLPAPAPGKDTTKDAAMGARVRFTVDVGAAATLEGSTVTFNPLLFTQGVTLPTVPKAGYSCHLPGTYAPASFPMATVSSGTPGKSLHRPSWRLPYSQLWAP